jgi:VCBS repeat-containing protein
MRDNVKKSIRRMTAGARRDAKAVRLSDLAAIRLEDRTVPTLFSNTTPIAIPGTGTSGNANPYPSTISVSGLTGQLITNLKVIFNNLSHTAPDNIDAMVIAPDGTRIYAMSDAGGVNAINGVTLTFDDAAAGPLTTGQITTGSYQPTNIDQGDPDTIPGAPTTPPTVATTLSAFRGLNPNGTWELRVVDDAALDTGTMAGGWSLDITSKVNSPPVANNDTYTTLEDTTLNIPVTGPPGGVLNNDTDPDNDPLTAQLVSTTSHGALTFNANGSFNYVPKTNFNGTDTFTYRAYDGIVTSNLATVTINVTAVNDVPIANNDNLTVQNGGPQTIHRAVILDNDIDPDVTYRATILSENFQGLTLQPWNTGTTTTGDGTDWTDALPAGWTRDNTTTPPPPSGTAPGAEFFGWHAMDIDSWIAQQGNQDRNKFTLGGVGQHGTIMVADGDAYDDFPPGLSAGVRMNTYLYTPNIPLNGINVDSLTLEVDSSFRPEAPDPGHQTGDIQVSFDNGANWTTLMHLSNANSGGTGGELHINDHLTFDLHNAATATTVKVRFAYLDATNDWWWAVDNVKIKGDKTEPSQETIQIQSQPSQGSVAVDANGAVVYTPPTNTFTGTTSFTYRLFDGVATSNTATVNLTVNANNTAPVAVNDSYSTFQGIAVTSHYADLAVPGVLANDTDVDLNGGNVGMKAVLVTGPTAAQGTLTLNPDGTFVFTPNPAFFGNASFTYKVNDGSRDSNTATVTIAVVQTNLNPPVAVNDTYSVNNNGTLTVAGPGVLANDTDADGNPLTAVALANPNNQVIGPNNGTLTLLSNGSFTYVPRPYFNGTDTFQYRAFDGAFFSNVATVTITVNAVNVAPQANPDTYTTPVNTPLTVPAAGVLKNDRDDGPNSQLFLETFDSLPLQAFNTGVPGGDGTDWTDALPTGWTRDNTTTPAPASSTTAGAEFFGFHVMDVDSWIAEQGNQARSDFTRGGTGLHGTVVVADGDAYDDFIDIHTSTRMNTLLSTPSIPLGTITPNSLVLEFDSSFRPEVATHQVGKVEVSYDNGTSWNTLLDLNQSNSGGTGSRLRTNEHLALPAFNPAGATAAKFRFSYLNATNDWWWAIDNVKAVGSNANAGATLTAQIVTQPPASQGTVALNSNGSFTFTPATGFTGTASFTYRVNDGVNNSTPTAVNILVGRQVSVQIDDGTGQRSMVRSLNVVFNGVATFAASPQLAFQLTDATNTAVPFFLNVSTSSGTTVATITFGGAGIIGGSLPDGNYTLTVLSNQITIAGQALDGDNNGTPGGDSVIAFHRLFGDVNGDKAVDGFDLTAFRNAFGSVTGNAAYVNYLDFNQDGAIDGADLTAFRNRFGVILP